MATVLRNHKAKKRFGQNFLKEDFWIEKIASAIDAKPGQKIIEIGPGQAALTRLLIRDCGRISCVEIDRDLAGWLKRQFDESQLDLIEMDALKADWKSILTDAPDSKVRIVGNLPYNISSPLLFKLLGYADLVKDQHFMLQKEVVDRMVASPGSRAYGRLSVMLQHRYAMVKLFDVPPEAFSPAPKVVSSVVRMIPYERPETVDQETFEKVVTQAFGMKRKTLRNNFRDVLDDKDLEAVGINPEDRAEQVPVSLFVKLTNSLGDKFL